MQKRDDAGGKLNITDGEPTAHNWECTWEIGETLENI